LAPGRVISLFLSQQRVPLGKVFSVDIQPEMLARIEQRKALENVVNVETVLGEADDPKLPDNAIDLAFIVDAYHEFSFPREMGERLKESLKPGGQLVLVEYRAEDPRVPIKRLHKMSERQVKQEMAAIGFDWVRTEATCRSNMCLFFRSQGPNPEGQQGRHCLSCTPKMYSGGNHQNHKGCKFSPKLNSIQLEGPSFIYGGCGLLSKNE
jgi:SAM-dependent methyltransferase